MPTTLCPYLMFDSAARPAMEFYHAILGGKLDLQTFAESGMETPDQYKNDIVHAMLTSGAITIMASDVADRGVTPGDNVQLSLVGEHAEELTSIFTKLAEGGTIDMPLEKQFWGDVFGSVTDKFGIKWMVNISAPKTK